MPKLSLIICTDIKNGIGKHQAIPWHNKVDLKNFKRLTTNNIIVMGRKTWETLPVQPLPNRLNIIISKSMYNTFKSNSKSMNTVVFESVEDFLYFKYLLNRHNPLYKKEWFIIGGSSLYNYFLKHINMLDNIYWTKMDMDYHCDVKIEYSIDDLLTEETEWKEITNDRTRKLNGRMKNASYHYIKKNC